MERSAVKDSLVTCRSGEGVEIRASLLRVTRYLAVFEVYNPSLVLQASEVLADFKVTIQERPIYAGRAVVTTLVNTGTMLLCEAKLDETGFLLASFSPERGSTWLQEGFENFLHHWQKIYKVLPDFKVVVADMQAFLADLRLWLDQVELEMRSAPSSSRLETQKRVMEEIGGAMVPAFNAMHERLESVSEGIDADLRPVHQNFAKRQLHPLVLCSPFAYRTYQKPLGYAGDYEMVDMILRDPYEGSSLFAKVMNLWFWSQWPARAHRNRIEHLKRLLAEETRRKVSRGQPVRILNLGCGPAREIQEFLAEEPLCDKARFNLLDFNEETIRYTSRVLEDCRRRYGRRTHIEIQKKSVHHVLKEGARPIADVTEKSYDLIYCAGLLDYLSDRTCAQLMTVLYDWLAPGGLLAATNVEDCRPFRHMLEFVLDWHLIYRGTRKSAALLPQRVAVENTRIFKDPTEVNVFIETRKPEDG
ncbi:MAG TPA: class I SAM-dependent methyltransferase [Candidatus Paceibacterota bacterium]|nr:class I SAM-dependent methyltransferase [Verrucomicrobiota bacterium]HSA10410.1 class I SAM-dependent methyltransferase [Candidatus Paceibacterota bacterium]